MIICLRQLLCAGSLRPNITWFPLFPISADYSLYGDIMAHGFLQLMMRSILDKAYHPFPWTQFSNPLGFYTLWFRYLKCFCLRVDKFILPLNYEIEVER